MGRLLVFAVAVFALHTAPGLAGDAGTWIDLATPFAVVGAAAWALLGARADRRVLALAFVSALAYVDGHGIHLSANDIGHVARSGRQHFWDEEFGHAEWHLGWLGLLAALAWSAREERPRPARAVAAAVLLGFTLFTSTVEGGSWWLVLAAAPPFAVWALLRPRPVRTTIAASVLLASALIAGWAIVQDGVPQFSEVGWL
jgi:hypothetical protein